MEGARLEGERSVVRLSAVRDGEDRDSPLDPYRAIYTATWERGPPARSLGLVCKEAALLRGGMRARCTRGAPGRQLEPSIPAWNSGRIGPIHGSFAPPTSRECPGQKSGPAHPALCSDNLPEGEAGCLEGNGTE